MDKVIGDPSDIYSIIDKISDKIPVDKTTEGGWYGFILANGIVLVNAWGFYQFSFLLNPIIFGIITAYIVAGCIGIIKMIRDEKKSKVVLGKYCPYCNRELNTVMKYSCPECGEIITGKPQK